MIKYHIKGRDLAAIKPMVEEIIEPYRNTFFTGNIQRHKAYGMETSPTNIKAKKVIFNNPATIVLWNDGSKTIVKAMESDVYNKERGFLQAYFEKHSGLSRTQANKLIRKYIEDSEV